MARDMQTAKEIVSAVMAPIMATELGNVLVEVNGYQYAIQRAVEAVADLLDPEETFDVEVEEDDVRRCDKCGAICDPRLQVCECDPSVCSYPPISRYL